MKSLFLLFFIPLFSFVITGQWEKVQIDERTTIEFPGTPTKNEASDKVMWIYDLPDSSRCMATSADLSLVGLDSATIASFYDTDLFFNGMRDGILKELGDASTTSQNKLSVSNKPAYDFVFTKDNIDTEIPYKKTYTRVVFAGATTYVLSYYEKKNSDKSELREKFFNSIKID